LSVFSLLHYDDLLVVRKWMLWLAAIVTVVVGAPSALVTNHVNQDLWMVDAYERALFIVAFSASTGSVGAGLLTGMFKRTAASAAGGGGGGGAGGARGVLRSPGARSLWAYPAKWLWLASLVVVDE